MRRALLLAAALTVPLSGASVLMAGPAGAAAQAKFSKISCTTLTGTVTGTTVVSGCKGGNTGGSSQPLNSSTLATGGTITWVSGSTTTISAPVLKSTSATKCPGYVKGGSSNPTADKFTATVTADTGDNLKVPGKATGAVCISSSGAISALKPLKAT
jgi:hypothetical protein